MTSFFKFAFFFFFLSLFFCRSRNSVWRLMLPGQTRLSLRYLSLCTMRVCVQTAGNLSPSSFSPPGQCCRTSWLSHWCPTGMPRYFGPPSVDAGWLANKQDVLLRNFTWIKLDFFSHLGASLSKFSLHLSARRAWMPRKHDWGLEVNSWSAVLLVFFFPDKSSRLIDLFLRPAFSI